MPVQTINSYEEFKAVVNSGKPAVFDFWATWCGPCKVISPIFERFSDAEKFSSVGFYKVDVDALVEVSKEVGIRAMPTFVLFKDGQKVDQSTGAVPQKLQELIQKGL